MRYYSLPIKGKKKMSILIKMYKINPSEAKSLLTLI